MNAGSRARIFLILPVILEYYLAKRYEHHVRSIIHTHVSGPMVAWAHSN